MHVHSRAVLLLLLLLLQELARYEIDVRNIIINQLIFPEAGEAPVRSQQHSHTVTAAARSASMLAAAVPTHFWGVGSYK